MGSRKRRSYEGSVHAEGKPSKRLRCYLLKGRAWSTEKKFMEDIRQDGCFCLY